MGCDIHIRCEVKRNNKWELNTKDIFPNPWYEFSLNDPDWSSPNDEFTDTPESTRLYDWFAILANIRNNEGFNVISEPRGIPKDISKECKVWLDKKSDFLHSHSYLRLKDFDEFNWNNLTMKFGLISLNAYDVIRKTKNPPTSWSTYVSGDNVITVGPALAKKILKNPEIKLKVIDTGFLFEEKIVTIDDNVGEPANKFNIFVNHEWPVRYIEWFDTKIKNIIEPMRKLKEEYDDVRIVFAFDN